MKLGYDLYSYSGSIVSLLNSLKKDHIQIFYLHVHSSQYYFYVPIYQRRKMMAYHLKKEKSIGILSFCLILFRKMNMIVLLTFFLTLSFMNHRILDIQIKGDNPHLNHELLIYLKGHHIQKGQSLLSYQTMNRYYNDIKDRYLNKVNYLNIYQRGCVLKINYTGVKSAKETKLHYHNLIASHSGVIERIDVTHGNVLVSKNQYVKKGDILVSHTIESTNKKTRMIPTQGKIYAYVVQEYRAVIDHKVFDKNDAFSYLLFQIRKQLPNDCKIDKETVKVYDIIKKKIELKVQYIYTTNIAIEEN